MGDVFQVCTLGGQDEDIERKGIMIQSPPHLLKSSL
jgi:hypothetical protein